MRIVGVLAFCACGGGGGGGGGSGGDAPPGRISAIAHVVHGPSNGSTHATFAPAAPSDGFWVVTPTSVKATVVSINFSVDGSGAGPGSIAMLSSCAFTYDQAAASMSPVLDCAFDLDPGTYKGFGVSISNLLGIEIDDGVDGIYTDSAAATKLSTSAPSGGAAYVTLDLTANGPTSGVNYFLPQPFVAAEGGPAPEITVVVDAIRTVQIEVASGVPSFRTNQIAPIVLFGSPSGMAQAEYYAQLPGIGGYNYSQPPVTNGELRVYYSAPYTPVAAFLSRDITDNTLAVYATDPAGGTGSRAGGRLGEDSSHHLCWAGATDYTWTTYNALYELPELTTIGGMTQLAMLSTASPPPPTSDGTYSDGCFTSVPSARFTLDLSAN